MRNRPAVLPGGFGQCLSSGNVAHAQLSGAIRQHTGILGSSLQSTHSYALDRDRLSSSPATRTESQQQVHGDCRNLWCERHFARLGGVLDVWWWWYSACSGFFVAQVCTPPGGRTKTKAIASFGGHAVVHVCFLGHGALVHWFVLSRIMPRGWSETIRPFQSSYSLRRLKASGRLRWSGLDEVALCRMKKRKKALCTDYTPSVLFSSGKARLIFREKPIFFGTHHRSQLIANIRLLPAISASDFQKHVPCRRLTLRIKVWPILLTCAVSITLLSGHATARKPSPRSFAAAKASP